MDYINDILNLSPSAALGFMLYLLGAALKKSPIADWKIPFVLIVLGAMIYALIGDASKVDYSVHHPQVMNGVYGACIGGMTVAANQMVKQFLGRRGTGDTTTFNRPTNPP